MVDKIKVNLSSNVYYTIIQDMFQFEYFKNNGEINKNEFLNVLIYNFYQIKLRKREDFKKKLKENALPLDLSNKNKDKLLDEAIKIMDNYYNEDINYRYHNEFFMIYPTKVTENFFNNLYENEIKNKSSLSSFIRKILNEYVSLPQYVRENIIKRAETFAINEAIGNNKIVFINVSGVEYYIAPFALIENNEETFSYLIGLDVTSKKNSPITVKLSKIHNVTSLNTSYYFKKEEKETLINIINSGVEFASGDFIKVKIKFSHGGFNMFKYRFHNRPNAKKIDDLTCEVSCTLTNFVNYFLPFGKEIEILNNSELKSKFAKFYKEAYESYK